MAGEVQVPGHSGNHIPQVQEPEPHMSLPQRPGTGTQALNPVFLSPPTAALIQLSHRKGCG